METDFSKSALEQRLKNKVGREVEIDIFQKSLDALINHLPPDPTSQIYRVLFLSGQGGIGKTFLLSQFENICKEKNVPLVKLDALDSTGQPNYLSFADFLRDLCLRLEDEPWIRNHWGKRFSRFTDAWEAYRVAQNQIKSIETKGSNDPLTQSATGLAGAVVSSAVGIPPVIGERGAEVAYRIFDAWKRRKQIDLQPLYEHIEHLQESLIQDIKEALDGRPIVILLDSCDGLQEIEPKVNDFLIKYQKVDRLVVFAARTRPGATLQRELIGYFWPRFVQAFTETEAREYLMDKRRITIPEVVNSVIDLAAGLPLALGVAADAISTLADPRQAIEWKSAGSRGRVEILAQVAQWLLWSQSEEQCSLILLC